MHLSKYSGHTSVHAWTIIACLEAYRSSPLELTSSVRRQADGVRGREGGGVGGSGECVQ